MPLRIDGDFGFNIGGVRVRLPIFGDRRNTSKVGEVKSSRKNDISTIVAQASNSGMFSRPNLYRMEITPPRFDFAQVFNEKWTPRIVEDIGYNCDTCSIPGHALSTKPNKTYSLKKEYVYDKMYDPIGATFYVSEDLAEYHFFEDWIKLMYDQRTGDINYYNHYTGTITIFELSRNKKREGGDDLATISAFKLIEAYPKTISPLRLGYVLNNQVQKVDIQFVFRTMISESFTTTAILPDLKSTSPLRKGLFGQLFRNLNVRGGFKLFGQRQLFNIFNKP